MQNTYIETVLADGKKAVDVSKAEFGHLTTAQINWKPDAKSWSVGQCFEHLLKTNEGYIHLLESINDGSRKGSFLEKMPFLPGFFGKLLYDAVKPEAAKKNKTFAAYDGSSSNLNLVVINEFASQLELFMELLVKSDALADHSTTIITSPLSPIVVYSLKDAAKIVVAHSHRHINQAKRVVQSAAFPKN